MNPLLLIGAGVLAYYLLKGSGGQQEGRQGAAPGVFNPFVAVYLLEIKGSNAVLGFVLKPVGGKFKNNRVAGGIYFGEERITEFRDAKNFTLTDRPKMVSTKVSIPSRFLNAAQNPQFWGSLRAVGNFEDKDKKRLEFSNPIETNVPEGIKRQKISIVDILLKVVDVVL